MAISIKAIDKQTLTKAIRPALVEKLEELSKELGIQIAAGRATYAADGQTGTGHGFRDRRGDYPRATGLPPVLHQSSSTHW